MNKGFTLIELLVVVLIIGILAAIALPQYRVAVLKSKTVPLLSIMRTVMNAEEEYELSGSNATTAHIIADVDSLAISLPGYEKECGLGSDSRYDDCHYRNGDVMFSIAESNDYIVGFVLDKDRHEILSMNMLSRAGQELTKQGLLNTNWAEKDARSLCEYPASSSQAAAAAAVCKSICGGNPFHTGRGSYQTCYFN